MTILTLATSYADSIVEACCSAASAAQVVAEASDGRTCDDAFTKLKGPAAISFTMVRADPCFAGLPVYRMRFFDEGSD
jgi:hypothetical protein